LGFWQFLCITTFVHTREHYFFSNLVSDTSPPSVSAQALCFSVLDAVFGMTLEFGKPSCRLGAMWGGAVSPNECRYY